MSDQPGEPDNATEVPALPGKIENSPDPRKVRERRAKYRGWRRRLHDYIVVPAEIPQDFNEPLSELVSSLSTDDGVTATAILDEAQSIFDETLSRIESAERRATTLQGTVAIAASLVVAGAGLMLDPSKVAGRGWRIVLVIILAGFVGSLIGCAWRALAVTGRMFEFEQPGSERIHLRAKEIGPHARTFRAAELLRAAGVASEIGAVKVGLLRSAAWWLRLALSILGAFVIALAIYVVTTGSSTGNLTPPRATCNAPHLLRHCGVWLQRP
jgi:hypothetical protein